MTLNVQQRIAAGFFCVIVAMGAGLAIEHRGLVSAETRFASYTELADGAALAARIETDMANARLVVREYIASRDAALRAPIETALGELSADIEELGRLFGDDDAAADIEILRTATAEFGQGVVDLVALYEQRDDTVARLEEVG
ncbi:MAG: hypothetical protein AAF684_11045, partial [Pseudomonadota bacterium]